VAIIPHTRGKIEVLGALSSDPILIVLDKSQNKFPRLKFIEFTLDWVRII